MQNQKILVPLADISFIAGEMNYFTCDSRADVASFILWVKEFEKANDKTNWAEIDYRLAIEEYAM